MSGAKQPYYHKEFVLSTYKDNQLFFVKSFAVFFYMFRIRAYLL